MLQTNKRSLNLRSVLGMGITILKGSLAGIGMPFNNTNWCVSADKSQCPRYTHIFRNEMPSPSMVAK